MSALSSLTAYGSDSDKSDDEANTKRVKLPPPRLHKIAVVSKEDRVDDPALHGGRTRSFPHVRGNWATFVYIQYKESEGIHSLLTKISNLIEAELNESCNSCEDLHISLSKTFVLKFHQIESFSKSLHASLKSSESFEVNFNAVKIYCNEERTRTFIALEVDYFSQRNLSKVTGQVDETLLEYNLPTFYEDPSFHMSILWVNGDKSNQLKNHLSSLTDIVTQAIGKELRSTSVEKINCRSGNKYFQYFLD